MSQKSLVYHLHPEDGYWLYSVGENGVDEMSKGLTPKTSQLNVTSFSLLKNGSDDLSWSGPSLISSRPLPLKAAPSAGRHK